MMTTCKVRNSFAVEQAVFASSDRSRMKGYQLVAKSMGVDRLCSQELCRWAPTQFPTADPENWTINSFLVNPNLVAVTRTVLGGPEYSGRGGTQVVTLILLLSSEQFASYHDNAITVARTALATGSLRLPLDMTREKLPQATLPRQPLVEPVCSVDDLPANGSRQGWLDRTVELIDQGRRVAIIGLNDPIDGAENLTARLSADTRRTFSFTTGLAPAVRRPFQAHFVPAHDAAFQRTFQAQNIIPVDTSDLDG